MFSTLYRLATRQSIVAGYDISVGCYGVGLIAFPGREGGTRSVTDEVENYIFDVVWDS